jgi:hypothetical protein
MSLLSAILDFLSVSGAPNAPGIGTGIPGSFGPLFGGGGPGGSGGTGPGTGGDGPGGPGGPSTGPPGAPPEDPDPPDECE